MTFFSGEFGARSCEGAVSTLSFLGARWEYTVIPGRSLGVHCYFWALSGSTLLFLGALWEYTVIPGRSRGVHCYSWALSGSTPFVALPEKRQNSLTKTEGKEREEKEKKHYRLDYRTVVH